jgi:uncharacterized Zn-binding protein involved in type VI secretion
VIGDTHACPVTDGPKPHVGGAVAPPGVPTVLALNRPANPAPGNPTICVGVPNVSAKGGTRVLVLGRMWARVGDNNAHGGAITGPGAVTILVGA